MQKKKKKERKKEKRKKRGKEEKNLIEPNKNCNADKLSFNPNSEIENKKNLFRNLNKSSKINISAKINSNKLHRFQSIDLLTSF